MGSRNDRIAWARFVRLATNGALVRGPNKYRAEPTIVDGIRFASKKEARRYVELCLLQKAGAIRNLETQPRYPLSVVELWRPGPPSIVRCGVFTADFRYVDAATGAVVIEDTKSGPTKTEAYRLRKRLVEAIHGIKILET